MAVTYGEVQQLSFFIYSWKLPGGILPKSCYSDKFFVYGDNYFYFRCFESAEDTWDLYLHSPSKDRIEFDIHIELKYVYSTKDFSKTYSKNCLNGLIGSVKGDLLEVVCSFSRFSECCKAEIWANFINESIQKENFEQLQTYLKKTNEYWIKRKEGLERLQKYMKEKNGNWEKIDEYLKALQKGLTEANEKWVVEGKDYIPGRVEKKIQLLSLRNEANIINKIDDLKQTMVLCGQLVMVLKETNEKYVQAKEYLEQRTQQEKVENIDKAKGVEVLNEDLRSLFLNEEDSDVLFVVGDSKYPGHTRIIEKQSSVLQKMSKCDMKEKNIKCINIPDCDPLLFRDFLFYLYTGNVDISKENVFDMYSMSVTYDVIQLNVICVDYMKNNLSIDTICNVMVLANKYSDQDLFNRAINFFMLNAKEIFRTVMWLKFMKENTVLANEVIIKVFDEILATGGKVCELIDISD